MEDDGSRLAYQSQFRFDAVDRLLEILRFYIRGGGGIERTGKEILLAAGPSADRIGFVEGAAQVARNEAPQFMQVHMIVFILEQMQGEVLCAAALVSDQNHSSKPRSTFRASMRASRMARIWAQVA